MKVNKCKCGVLKVHDAEECGICRKGIVKSTDIVRGNKAKIKENNRTWRD